VSIRKATARDWPHIWPFFDEIVQAGETYAFPLDLTIATAEPWWMSDERGAHIGTASFMVSPTARGRGVGRRLAEHVIAWHRDQGFAGIQFNAVVETNIVAVRLWQDLGFEIIGTVPGAFQSASHGRVGLHVMYREI
jgi:GNAT superfamily N-acetyltransferase